MLSTKLKEAAGNSADATLYVDDVFSTYLYTGNGSTQTITNGIDLAGKGGLVWVKSRSIAGDSHFLTDTERGVNKVIYSNLTNAQVTKTVALTNFNSDGFTLGSEAGMNDSADVLASWTLRKAAKFFDVVTYTGDGTSYRQINHSLGITPGMIIVKATSASGDWIVWHRGCDPSNLSLNQTLGAQTGQWSIQDATTTNFGVANDTSPQNWPANTNGITYVAYLFAHDTSSTGIIQCGSYTGTGADNNSISLGWEPQFILIKRASGGTGSWVMCDVMRGIATPTTYDTPATVNSLNAESSNAETSAFTFGVTATGFNLRESNTQLNNSGDTYIYMAIRRPNKPPTSGTQVFSPSFASSSGGYTAVSNFPPDLNFYASKNTTDKWFWFSRLIGASYLRSNTTAAEQAVGATVNYTNTSFNMPTITGDYSTYINYMFKRAPGFFDEVCYTGNSVSNRAINHNLSVAPELIIVKNRSSAASWWVYCAYSNVTNPQNYFLILNTNDAKGLGAGVFGVVPTNALFYVGTSGDVNLMSSNYVAYLFATLAGISKVGSYTGNGTGQAIACGFGSGGARFVLIKRTDSTGDWYTFDSARGLTSGSSPYLLLNSTAAEVTGNNGVYASSGGFTLGATAITTTNIATATYIFLAVA